MVEGAKNARGHGTELFRTPFQTVATRRTISTQEQGPDLIAAFMKMRVLKNVRVDLRHCAYYFQFSFSESLVSTKRRIGLHQNSS